MSINKLYADSPLTSTDIYKAYKSEEIIKTVSKSRGVLTKDIIDFLLDKSNPIDIKLAVINKLGWKISTQDNYNVLLTAIRIKYNLKRKKNILKKLNENELICLAYLKAMDNYFNVEHALKIANMAKQKTEKSFSIHIIAALIEAQNEFRNNGFCKIYDITNKVRLDKRLNIDMKEQAIVIIFKYMVLYKDDVCDEAAVSSNCNCNYKPIEIAKKHYWELEERLSYQKFLMLGYDIRNKERDYANLFFKCEKRYEELILYSQKKPIIFTHKDSGFWLNLTPCQENVDYFETNFRYSYYRNFSESFLEDDFNYTAYDYLKAYYKKNNRQDYHDKLFMIIDFYLEDDTMDYPLDKLKKDITGEIRNDYEGSFLSYFVEEHIKDKDNDGEITETEKEKISRFLRINGEDYDFSGLHEFIFKTYASAILENINTSYSVSKKFIKHHKKRKRIEVLFNNIDRLDIDNHYNFVKTKMSNVCMDIAEINKTGIIFKINRAMLLGALVSDISNQHYPLNLFNETIDYAHKKIKKNNKSTSGLLSSDLDFFKIPYKNDFFELKYSKLYYNNNLITSIGTLLVKRIDSNTFKVETGNNTFYTFSIDSFKDHLQAIGIDQVKLSWTNSNNLQINLLKVHI